jgi:hypothetical protein
MTFSMSLTLLRAEISKSRANAWGKVIARRHQVLQVFTNDREGHDLMIIGVVKMTLWNGESLEMQFASRFVVDDSSVESNDPRLSLVQVFAVRFPSFSVSLPLGFTHLLFSDPG